VRVLLVNDIAPDVGWGTETHLRRLIAGLTAAGDDVDVFAGEVEHHGAAKVLDLWDPFARRALQGRAARFRPDVVHHLNVVRELSVSVLGVPGGTPTVMTVLDQRILGAGDYDNRSVRGALDAYVKRPFDTRVARRHLDAAIAVSEPIAVKLRAAGFRGVEHVPVYALDPVVALAPVTSTRDVVYAGRLTPDKGLSVLVEAFERIAAEFPDARLLVAGDGPERERVAALAGRLDAGRVQLLGRLDEEGISRLFAAARVVVLPSLPSVRPEGSPLTAVEAALHGRPIVASDDPGLVEIVRVLGAGRCVKAGDSDALAQALTEVLRNDVMATQWGATARDAAAATYAPARVTEKVRAVHERVVRSVAR